MSSASTRRPPTPPSAPGATARSCTSRSSGSPTAGRPRHATDLLDRGRGGRRRGRRLGGGRRDRRRARAWLLHRACGSRSRPPAGWRAPGCRRAASAPSRRSAAGIGESGRRRGSACAVIDGFRGEVFAALYSERGERLWEPLVCRPEELAEQACAPATPPAGRRCRLGTISARVGRERRPIADDSDPAHRIAARTCARWRRRGRARAPNGSTRSISDLQTRSDGVSETSKQRVT